jgi:hypothetical protein
MAELTKLGSKLGEVTGLAMAAEVATEKVRALTDGEDAELATTLEQMPEEAAETKRRCVALAGGLEGKKTAILDEAASTKGKAAQMLKAYLDSDSEALDGFEFLTMAEAGEVEHRSILKTPNQGRLAEAPRRRRPERAGLARKRGLLTRTSGAHVRGRP